MGGCSSRPGSSAPRRPGERSLREWRGSDFDPGWGEWDVRGTVLGAGFALDDYREQLLRVRYLDIAAVVFTLRSVPWTVGPFRVEDHHARLRELHAVIERGGALVTASTAVFVRATKPRS